MLTGENGILEQAAYAKKKTERESYIEERELRTMEMLTDLEEVNSNLNAVHGCLTNIELKSQEKGEVALARDVKGQLPPEYSLFDINNENEITDDSIVTTGTTVRKNGKEIGRVVIYGDVNCDGYINVSDASEIENYMGFLSKNVEYYQIMAGNVYEDDELNTLDSQLIARYVSYSNELRQNLNSEIPERVKRHYKKIQEYINKLDKNSTYKFEYNEEEDTYKLVGVKKGTTALELKNALPDSTDLVIRKNPIHTLEDDEIVEDGYQIWKKFTYELKSTWEDEDGNKQEYTEEIPVNISFATIEVK